MGARQSQQRYVHGYHSNEELKGVNLNAQQGMLMTFKVTETQYGSWTKLSITDATDVLTPAVSSLGDSDLGGSGDCDLGGSDEELQKREEMGVTCREFLTQPPSDQQESILREVAEKLIDVDPDVTETDLSYNAPCFTAKVERPSKKPCLYYSLNMHPMASSRDEAKKKEIDKSLLDHFEALVEELNPEEVVYKLYGIAVLDSNELECASDMTEPQEDRARALLQLIRKKLSTHPQWFADICKILRNCGVKVITEVIEEVQNKCPTEELGALSPASLSKRNTKSSTVETPVMRQKTCCPHTFLKLEQSFKENSIEGATEFVHQICAEQPDLVLVNEASKSGVDVATLDLLLAILAEENHSINSKDERGQTPLHIACASLRSPESDPLNVEQRLKIEHLLLNNASNWIKDKDGNTPLHLAVLRANSEVVSLLLKSEKRCLNIVNKRGNTALHLACKQGCVDIVKILCGYNADASIQNKKMRTALHLACIYEHVDAAVELASHDPSTLDAFDKHRKTPLHISCSYKRNSNTLAMSLLKLKNCCPNKADREDKTPLHYACFWGDLDLVTGLLGRDQSKAFVDAQDRYGDTALHIASCRGFKGVVKELLNHKASREIMNQEGKSPLDVAIECDHDSIAAKMLRKRGWAQRHKNLSRVRKLRRTLTQSSLATSIHHLENFESSDGSEEDETQVL